MPESSKSKYDSSNYLKEDFETYATYDRTKFFFQEMSEDLKKSRSILDVGCAKGAFLFHALKVNPDLECHGIDPAGELVEEAKKVKELNDSSFESTGLLEYKTDRKFDFVLASGVLSIFDSYEKPLERILELTRAGGKVFIFSGFNSRDVDVKIQFKNNESESPEWRSGINMFSQNTIETYLQGRVSQITWKKFPIQVDLPPSSDPMKAYTLTTKEAGKILVNGANIVREFYLLSFSKAG